MTDFLFGFYNKCTFQKLIGILFKILSIHINVCTLKKIFDISRKCLSKEWFYLIL